MLKRILPAVVAAFIVSVTAHANGPAPTKQQRQFEIRFLEEMMDHHAMAVMMADLCMERAIHPELRQLCESIKQTQTEEIVTMHMWLEDWYGIVGEHEMTKGMERQMQKLAALSGAEFEIEFLKMMIRHHRTAVVRAQECQDAAYHGELIQLCENIESTQRAEIQLMSSWLCQWYGICDYGA